MGKAHEKPVYFITKHITDNNRRQVGAFFGQVGRQQNKVTISAELKLIFPKLKYFEPLVCQIVQKFKLWQMNYFV